ncbi:hypothetical protein CAter10_2263 [Collimonas arenae]|nr:hypothetical protein CAter10_2263 [Collimonas arenae]
MICRFMVRALLIGSKMSGKNMTPILARYVVAPQKQTLSDG